MHGFQDNVYIVLLVLWFIAHLSDPFKLFVCAKPQECAVSWRKVVFGKNDLFWQIYGQGEFRWSRENIGWAVRISVEPWQYRWSRENIAILNGSTGIVHGCQIKEYNSTFRGCNFGFWSVNNFGSIDIYLVKSTKIKFMRSRWGAHIRTQPDC